MPGGLGEAVFRARDTLLRAIAKRKGLVVPSLLADVRVADDETTPEHPVDVTLAMSSAALPDAELPAPYPREPELTGRQR